MPTDEGLRLCYPVVGYQGYRHDDAPATQGAAAAALPFWEENAPSFAWPLGIQPCAPLVPLQPSPSHLLTPFLGLYCPPLHEFALMSSAKSNTV